MQLLTLTPLQSKLARLALNWTQETLSLNSRLSLDCIRTFEQGIIFLNNDPIYQMMDAFEVAGIQFLQDGIIYKPSSHVNEKTAYHDLLQEQSYEEIGAFTDSLTELGLFDNDLSKLEAFRKLRESS